MRLAPRGKGGWTKAFIRIGGFSTLLFGGIYLFGLWVPTMPGESKAGPLPKPSVADTLSEGRVKATVYQLAKTIGPRDRLNFPNSLEQAAVYITGEFEAAGLTVKSLPYTGQDGEVRNLEAVLKGTGASDEVIVVGAHYDSVPTTPGADDNASGVAAMLEIARLLRGKSFTREIRFVAFVNEEPPHFKQDDMGSLVYAKALKAAKLNVVAMFSLETMGYFDDTPGAQEYPPPLNWFYPNTGDFLAFVTNIDNSILGRWATSLFRSVGTLPSEGATAPSFLRGIDLSDHWAFWQVGYPGVMVSDTAFFRNHRYHESSDTAETLDYDRLGRAASGMAKVIATLAAEGVEP